MSEKVKSPVVSSGVVAKAGLWYTVCNFLFRGMAFITTPIFARLMTQAELGSFTNYCSWLSILTILTSLDLSQSIIRSKLEHEKDMDSYIWSILSLGSLITLAAYGVVCVFQSFFVELFEMDMKYIHVMFLYLLVSPAYQMLITKHRAFYKYKSFVVLTGVNLVSAILLSLAMVFLMENNLTGRIVGYYLPYIVTGLAVYIHLACRGKRIKLAYWKYACVICVPLVPHVLSLNLLNSSDLILLTKYQGEEFTALYSIAYSCYHIATILFDSLNKAWAPWLLDSLHAKRYGEIQKVSKIYVGVFFGLMLMLMLLVPEVIWILGGEAYMPAIYCMPALLASCMIQLVYTMYVNVEFYMKKTIGVAGATIVATLVNLLLDLWLVPISGANCIVVAAYTTLAGFAVLFVLHYLMVKRMGMAHVFNIKFLLSVLGVTLVVAGLMHIVYGNTILRYALVLIYGSALVVVAYKNKDKVLGLFFKKEKAVAHKA